MKVVARRSSSASSSRARSNSAIRVRKNKPTRPAARQSAPKPTPEPTRKGKGLFQGIGSMLGGMYGPEGAMVGGAAGDLLGSIIGFGDYKVESNSLVGAGNVPAQAAPQFANSKAETRIQHKEFIMDVVTSSGFSVSSLVLNPANSVTFPWLSTVASSYENYKFNGLVFTYVPTSGQVTNANPALGAVMLATNYDALAKPFTSKREMDSYEYSTSVVPFNSIMHAVECASGTSPLQILYTRQHVSGSLTAGAPGDPRMYDLGVTQVATQGMSGNYTCGELWVSYDVTLLKPRIDPDLGVPLLAFGFYNMGLVEGQPLLADDSSQITTGQYKLYNSFGSEAAAPCFRASSNSIAFNTDGLYQYTFITNYPLTNPTTNGVLISSNFDLDLPNSMLSGGVTTYLAKQPASRKLYGQSGVVSVRKNTALGLGWAFTPFSVIDDCNLVILINPVSPEADNILTTYSYSPPSLSTQINKLIEALMLKEKSDRADSLSHHSAPVMGTPLSQVQCISTERPFAVQASRLGLN